VAEILGKEEASCRQLYHRARARVQEGRPRFAASRAEHERLLRTFVDAMMRGDLHALEQTLAADATLWADSNGKVPAAARRPVHGAESVARFFIGLVKKFPAGLETSLEVLEVNGWPAAVMRVAGRASALFTIETDGQRIYAVRNVVNPDKLQRV
jgi:RNA polymerase sigma-70 factor (ECF subfamily)